MEKMTITRALARKKLLAKRIWDHARKISPMAVTVGGTLPPGFKSVDDFKKQARSDMDSLRNDMENYSRISQAIADSNAKTVVTVAGREYSVARALERKKWWSELGNECLDYFQDIYVNKKNECEKLSISEKEKEDREFSTYIGKDKALPKDEAETMRKIIAGRHAVELLDPAGFENFVETMRKERDDFLADVDIALTESNSRTEIEI